MEIGFAEALLTVGLLLLIAASLSGLMHGTVLSISVLSVAAGIVLAEAGVVSVDAEDASVVHLIELALVLTLFADGLLVDRELLWLHWSAPVRAIAVAMPITLVLLAGAALALFPELRWHEAFLLAAVLTPTDPVITSSVVSSPGVPAVVRHTLNLESGLNDGLALPFVLFFLVLAAQSGDAGSEAATLLGEAGAGAAIGAGLGYLGGISHQRLPGGGITHRYEGIWAVGPVGVRPGRDQHRQRSHRRLRRRGRTGNLPPRGASRIRGPVRKRELGLPGTHVLRLRRASRRHRI